MPVSRHARLLTVFLTLFISVTWHVGTFGHGTIEEAQAGEQSKEQAAEQAKQAAEKQKEQAAEKQKEQAAEKQKEQAAEKQKEQAAEQTKQQSGQNPSGGQQSNQQQVTPSGPTASGFETGILAGGAVNELFLVDVEATTLERLPRWNITWSECDDKRDEAFIVRSKTQVTSEATNDPSGTMLTMRIPPPPCTSSFLGRLWRWPVYQDATVQVSTQGSAQSRLLYEGTIPVSVRWFPLGMTVLVLAIVYPGCSLASFFLARRRFRKLGADETATPPSFLQQLDPVQITANQYGRASLPKFQIFAFSFIVFGLLVYYQFRNGILSGLSEDVLILLGISAVGTVGGKITYAAKRRFSLDNWAWLRRKKWQPESGEGIGRRAKWRELIVDADSEEFDAYSFQMAIFSIVVAVSLLTSNLSGLATFEIPNELLQLLGLSQVVFIAGKASEKSPYVELDEKIRTLRTQERTYQTARAAAEATTDATAKSNAQAQADTARAGFKTDVAQAADMFMMLFGDGLPRPLPDNLVKAHELEPEGFAPPAPPANP